MVKVKVNVNVKVKVKVKVRVLARRVMKKAENLCFEGLGLGIRVFD